MKKLFALFFLFIATIPVFSADWIGISKDSPTPARIRLVTSDLDHSVVQFNLDGYMLNPVQTPAGLAYTVSLDKATPLQEPGAPDLPKLTAALAIPDLAGMEVKVISEKYQDFPNIEIAPSKGVITRDIDPATVPYTYGIQYSTNAFFPASVAASSSPYIIRDVRGQNIIVYPFSYNPVTKTLRVYTELVVELKKVNDTGENQLLNKVIGDKENSEFTSLLKRHFLNGDNITYTVLNDYGNLLVICHGPFMSAIEPYVDWKTAMGYPTKLVDVSTIGTTAAAIKTYITNYYNANGLSFVMLVGDKPQIPTNTGGGLGGASDNAYGYIVGNDHYSDVFIGRFSAENIDQLNTQVQRTLDYEMDPGLLTDDWYTTVIGIASDQGPGDDGEYDYQHVRNQQSQLLAYTYTSNPELFDGSQGGNDAPGNPNPSQVATEVNNGSSLILYTGHGSTTSWGTSGFSNNNVNQLTNAGKLPFIWSVACVNGEFMNTTCFAEAWLRASQNGEPTGAIGFLGSTINQSWNSPMCGQDEMTDILAEAYPTNIKRTYAGISINGCMKMIDEYGTDGSNMADTWTLFGDPTLAVRTDNPVTMTVTHDQTLFAGSTTITVTCDVNDARATASLNDSLLATGLVANNTITLTFPGLTTPGDSVKLVVTAYNRIPYIAEIPIITATGPYILYVQNHVNDTTGNNNHQADFGEDPFLTLYLKNIGIAATTDLNVAISTTDPYVTITDGSENYGVMDPGNIKSIVDGFKFDIPVNVPDGHMVTFDVTATDIGETWNCTFSIPLHATALATGTVVVKDSLGNNNGHLDPGETAFLKIFIDNDGSAGAMNVNSTLLSGDNLVTIISGPQSYGNIGAGGATWKMYEVQVSASAPEGQYVQFLQQITADQGITAASTFDLIVGNIPILVVDFDGNANSGTIMKSAIEGLGLVTNYSLTIPMNISNYSAIFVSLGTYPDNHTLTNSEGQRLSTFLNDGGRVYMEGGDTWKYDPQTPVHPMFHIIADEDGSGDLGTVNGFTGTFTEGMSFIFGGDNQYIDRLSAGTDAFKVLENENPNYGTTIAYDAVTYRTIGSSSEFGGLNDTVYPSTKTNLMGEYLTFFGLNPPTLQNNFLAYPTQVLPGGTVSYFDFSTGGVTSWSWEFEGGNPATSTEQNPVVVYDQAGIYNTKLTISNGYDNVELTREDYITVDWPVGISESNTATCNVYPNPGDGIVTVRATTSDDNVTLEIRNITGSRIWSSTETVSGERIERVIDLRSQPAGVYLLTITGEKTNISKKIVLR